ncbi:3-oxo-5-alpha-steroid 4-dehydrogenase [Penicillium macrosclerotiorum]|uniref:3-oxo-5-alpha-steroid 4-dehydrogenase n=1 Tax=Penicillium macrosclerotiorum TaxID=303699 RepID=UPI00254943AC|nr:3-oxo-5-alpha-steroid 4-dehydrogenase [Penicillium macrosclerotiorum]KAJ5678896.1 3-oxo-5-alpha-steroid 4-dehydrogenase [Penicillium macrosclerotiorum]
MIDPLRAHVDRALEAAGMDAIDTLRAFFILAAATTVSISIPSVLRSRFLVYGPRATSSSAGSQPAAAQRSSAATALLDYLATWQVPHSYFIQFYIASVLSSVFWAAQLLSRGNLFQAIAARVGEAHRQQSMTATQVLICWLLLAIQGSRRLWECISFSKPSTSRMWFVHWLLGLGFYLAAGIAIWIEGSGTILSRSLSLSDLQMTNAPTLRTFLCVPLFLLASGIQHDCHHYLSSLKKYTLPDHPVFRGVVCPHYGAECIIYLSLAYLAAPPGQVVNKTMFACLAFVAVNLGLTAQTTKQWYMQKFGRETVEDWWLMIPYIY